MCGIRRVSPKDFSNLSGRSLTLYPPISKKSFLAKEYPFVCNPFEGSPNKISPQLIF